MKPPKSHAHLWWKRGVEDGRVCARKRRHRYFPEYLEKATAALAPGELLGPFECVYRCAFRAGYDAEKVARELRNTFSPRPKRRGNLKSS